MSKVFVIDVAKCSGCHNCQLACKDEHCENDWRPYAAPQPPTGQFWCKVTEHPRGTIPKVKIHYIPTICNHCRTAPCLSAAQNGAVYRRDDGLVVIDPEKAAGQKQLVEACPYGAIYWNEELQLPQKCTMCAELLDDPDYLSYLGDPKLKKPRCVEACPIGLNPYLMKHLCDKGDLKGAEANNVMECIVCGSCSYVCPAKRWLTASFKNTKDAIMREARRAKK